MLSLAGASARDYAILQVFLQTGLRVSELVALRIDDIDLANRMLHVRMGKGMAARSIELERKATQAIKNYLVTRSAGVSEQLFLNYHNEPISERGVRKLVTKYLQQAGIKKKASCHSLRHTFATAKAQQGISAYRLRDWLGHASLETTQIYLRQKCSIASSCSGFICVPLAACHLYPCILARVQRRCMLWSLKQEASYLKTTTPVAVTAMPPYPGEQIVIA